MAWAKGPVRELEAESKGPSRPSRCDEGWRASRSSWLLSDGTFSGEARLAHLLHPSAQIDNTILVLILDRTSSILIVTGLEVWANGKLDVWEWAGRQCI